MSGKMGMIMTSGYQQGPVKSGSGIANGIATGIANGIANGSGFTVRSGLMVSSNFRKSALVMDLYELAKSESCGSCK
jgi:hypothetical protein